MVNGGTTNGSLNSRYFNSALQHLSWGLKIICVLSGSVENDKKWKGVTNIPNNFLWDDLKRDLPYRIKVSLGPQK